MQYKEKMFKNILETLCICIDTIDYEMHVKIQINFVYKKTITFVDVSLADNHHIRAIVMIQRSTSRYQCILYPAKGLRPELPNGSTSLL